MVRSYRKKPVVIQAVQWTGSNVEEIREFVGRDARFEFNEDITNLYIWTLEGVHEATVGDYIIRGINGEFYPCKPDIFEKTYDIVEE